MSIPLCYRCKAFASGGPHLPTIPIHQFHEQSPLLIELLDRLRDAPNSHHREGMCPDCPPRPDLLPELPPTPGGRLPRRDPAFPARQHQYRLRCLPNPCQCSARVAHLPRGRRERLPCYHYLKENMVKMHRLHAQGRIRSWRDGISHQTVARPVEKAGDLPFRTWAIMGASI